eukprot:GHVL01005667.1.p1 GENE.GHVL01005667.1~~GHVL01005667.1.p1  ORF type:complete len:515 (-),score=71.19 GHVL01005667.1:85-1629(-)
MEPFIIHVEGSTTQSICKLLFMAKQCGLKNSGVVCLGDDSARTMIAIRGSMKLEAPVAIKRKLVCCTDYLPILLTECNRKMEKNQIQIQRFHDSLEKAVEAGFFNEKDIPTKSYSQIDNISSNCTNTQDVVYVKNAHNLKAIKSTLEKINVYDKKRKIIKMEEKNIWMMPVINLQSIVSRTEMKNISEINGVTKSMKEKKFLCRKLENIIESVPNKTKFSICAHEHVNGWVKYGDVLCLSKKSVEGITSFLSNGTDINTFFSYLCCALECVSIVLTGPIEGPFRNSSSRLVYGTTSIALVKENNITFKFDATILMFCPGNGTIRKRIAKEVMDGEVVVDCFCGIGYFSLGIAKRGKAKSIHACDHNLTALQALAESALLNNISPSSSALNIVLSKAESLTHSSPEQSKIGGFSCERCLPFTADRVLLGLIPSSEVGWRSACELAKSDGAVLHVHGVSNSSNAFSQHVVNELHRIMLDIHKKKNVSVKILRVEKVKSYAPRLWHFVIDVITIESS